VTYDRDEAIKGLQAIIFASDTPCDDERLAIVLELPVEDIEGLVDELSEQMTDSALQIVRLAGGYHMATRPRYARYVQRLREPEPERLSPQALETVAIIAYLGPITRPEIDEIRGVNSTGSVNSLLEKGLAEICGRKEAPGRPFLLRTTTHFLSTFGLNDLNQLPELSPSDADFREQLRSLVAEGADADEATLLALEQAVDTEAVPEGAAQEPAEEVTDEATEDAAPQEQEDS